MEYELVPLHKNKQHFDDCANILNYHWPRSKAAREHSLNKSCDGFPVCLAFRRVDGHEVVGFSQLVAVQGKDHACLLESVIIRENLRGTGLGRILMEATEDVARRKGMKTVYLNTLDKEGFYAHLSYTHCQPVTSLGANAGRVSEEFLQKLLGSGSTPAGSSSPTPTPDDRLSCGDPGTSAPSPQQPSSLPPLPHHHHYHHHPLHPHHLLQVPVRAVQTASVDMSYVWTPMLSPGCVNICSDVHCCWLSYVPLTDIN